MIHDDCIYDNLDGLLGELVEAGVDLIEWVESGDDDMSVFDDQKPMQLLDEWTDWRCQAFFSLGYLLAVSNNTNHTRRHIVEMWMENRKPQEGVTLDTDR